MAITVTIDWISCTMKDHNDETPDFLYLFTRDHEVLAATPRFGYTEAETYGSGVLVMWNRLRPEMGTHIQFSGASLRYLFEKHGITPYEVLKRAINSGCSVTRLDVAQDAENEKINIANIVKALEKGENKGTARSYSEVRSNDKGHTVYVGSRQSEKFIRIYHKGAEVGLPERDWIRYEIETKGDAARALSNLLATNDDYGSVFKGIAIRMLDLPHCDTYLKFFDSRRVPIGLPKIEKQTDRERWIEEQVIGAVAKHFQENPDSEAVNRLINTLLFLRDNS